MTKIEDVAKRLIGINITSDFIDEIIFEFDDYSYEGITEIIVTRNENDSSVDYQAYANHLDAPIICIKTIDDKITETWIQDN